MARNGAARVCREEGDRGDGEIREPPVPQYHLCSGDGPEYFGVPLFDGQLWADYLTDELRFFDHSLSEAEVALLAGVKRPCPCMKPQPDMAVPRDMAAPADMAAPSDFAMAADLSTPDLASDDDGFLTACLPSDMRQDLTGFNCGDL